MATVNLVQRLAGVDCGMQIYNALPPWSWFTPQWSTQRPFSLIAVHKIDSQLNKEAIKIAAKVLKTTQKSVREKPMHYTYS